MFELMTMIIMSLVGTKPYHVQSQVLLILLLILWNKIMLQYLTIRRKGLKEKNYNSWLLCKFQEHLPACSSAQILLL